MIVNLISLEGDKITIDKKFIECSNVLKDALEDTESDDEVINLKCSISSNDLRYEFIIADYLGCDDLLVSTGIDFIRTIKSDDNFEISNIHREAISSHWLVTAYACAHKLSYSDVGLNRMGRAIADGDNEYGTFYSDIYSNMSLWSKHIIHRIAMDIDDGSFNSEWSTNYIDSTFSINTIEMLNYLIEQGIEWELIKLLLSNTTISGICTSYRNSLNEEWRDKIIEESLLNLGSNYTTRTALELLEIEPENGIAMLKKNIHGIAKSTRRFYLLNEKSENERTIDVIKALKWYDLLDDYVDSCIEHSSSLYLYEVLGILVEMNYLRISRVLDHNLNWMAYKFANPKSYDGGVRIGIPDETDALEILIDSGLCRPLINTLLRTFNPRIVKFITDRIGPVKIHVNYKLDTLLEDEYIEHKLTMDNLRVVINVVDTSALKSESYPYLNLINHPHLDLILEHCDALSRLFISDGTSRQIEDEHQLERQARLKHHVQLINPLTLSELAIMSKMIDYYNFGDLVNNFCRYDIIKVNMPNEVIKFNLKLIEEDRIQEMLIFAPYFIANDIYASMYWSIESVCNLPSNSITNLKSSCLNYLIRMVEIGEINTLPLKIRIDPSEYDDSYQYLKQIIDSIANLEELILVNSHESNLWKYAIVTLSSNTIQKLIIKLVTNKINPEPYIEMIPDKNVVQLDWIMAALSC